MKKCIPFLVFIAALLSYGNIFAQDDDTRNSVRVGYHSAQMFADGSELFNKKQTGIYFGIARDIPFASIIHLNTGVEYFQNGSRLDDQNEIILSYISVPVGLKVKIGPVAAMGGASAGIRVASKEVFNGIESDPLVNDYQRFDGTVYLGASFRFLALGAEIRYHWGFRDVFDNYQNQYLQIGANLHFGR